MADANANRHPLPVRVWLGYGRSEYRCAAGRDQFLERLGSIFIPATVQMMQPWGLTAYLPTVMPVPSDSGSNIPDEIALVFYRSCEAYHQAAHASVGGRAYESLHSTVFNFDAATGVPASHSGFPVLFDMQSFLEQKQPYFSLFESHVDWQKGNTVTLVAAATEEALPISLLAETLSGIQSRPPEGLDGLVLTTASDVIVVWAHWRGEPAMMNLLAGVPQLKTVLNVKAVPATVPMPVTTAFAGVDVSAGYSASFQFEV